MNPENNRNNERYDVDDVIVVKSLIKSRIFMKHLKNLMMGVLNNNAISFKSIKKKGFFYIINLKNNDCLVSAMNLLGKISGISYIFIAIPETLDYDILSKKIIQIGKKIILENERFYIKIESFNDLESNKDNSFSLFKGDLEFFLQTELSSNTHPKIYCTNNESNADKILFILLGKNLAYVSLVLQKGDDRIPFKFFNDDVICPLYNDYSILSLVSILDGGFSPIPVFFYSDKLKLINIFKSFENITKTYPINDIELYIVNLKTCSLIVDNLVKKIRMKSIHEEDALKILIYDQIVTKILLTSELNSDLICLPFFPFLHPFWILKKNIKLCNMSQKTPITPFLFKNQSEISKMLSKFHGKSLNLTDDLFSKTSFVELTRNELEDIFNGIDKIVDEMEPIKFSKFYLDIGKDDILDILNSI